MKNIPKNHHYVSQCHIRNFFNVKERNIHLYDKELDDFYRKTTTKTVFSEIGLNTRLTDSGIIDNETIENDLKDNFEDRFGKNFKTILSSLSNNDFSLDFFEALNDSTKIAIIGNFRTPQFKSQMSDTIGSVFSEISDIASPQIKSALDKFFRDKSQTKYINLGVYSELASVVLEKMGSINYKIVRINSDDFFILPDCSSIFWRFRINEYFNPDLNDIAVVGIPLSSKIFLIATSNKLENAESQIMEINENNHEYVNELNNASLSFARRSVACENKDYLHKFIKMVEFQRPTRY